MFQSEPGYVLPTNMIDAAHRKVRDTEGALVDRAAVATKDYEGTASRDDAPSTYQHLCRS